MVAFCTFLALTAPLEATQLHATKYFCHNAKGHCQNLDNFCDADSVIWDNLVLNVNPGTLAGTYSLTAWGPNGYQIIVLVVEADGSYYLDFSTNGGNYWQEWSLNAAGFLWSIEGAPDGMEVSIDADEIIVDEPPTCDGEPIWIHGTVRVNIGAAELPPDEDQTKECDPSTDCQSCVKGPMATYFIHLMLASLHIEDTPISYNAPLGPLPAFKVSYNQREAHQPPSFDYSNFGPKWTFNWLSYVTDFPATPEADAQVYVRGGGTEPYHSFDPGSQSYAPHPQSLAVLRRTGSDTYERSFPDGSKEVFGPTGDSPAAFARRLFLTSVVDPAGNALRLKYEGLRLRYITDALGQSTTLDYEESDPFKITRVTDPFQRFATFQYSHDQLTGITDPIGILSHFDYEDGTDFIYQMTTPYGVTTFTRGEEGNHRRWLEVTDPLGGKERVEFNDAVDGLPAFDPLVPPYYLFNRGLNRANTFYWDKKAMADAPGDYTKARIIHWLTSADGAKFSGIKHSEKAPLERRVWYKYEGQTGDDDGRVGINAQPIEILRMMPDYQTQVRSFEYNNPLKKVTKAIDPANRVTCYIYDANQVDLLEIRQVSTAGPILRKFTYDTHHNVLTDTDAAAQTTVYVRNSAGQIISRENAKHEITSFSYGNTAPQGYLESITSPAFNGNSFAKTSYSYDASNRVHTVFNEADQYPTHIDYDSLDRKTLVTYFDGSSEEFKYTDNFTGAMTLDLTGTRDRLNRWTFRHYNANRQMDSITDAALRTTQYHWCQCGALESITDSENHTTHFLRDVQGRIYQKTFHDNSTISYLFEGQSAPNTVGITSRLKSSTDALNRLTEYSYNIDDNIAAISYTDPSGNSYTPSVGYLYDSQFNRVTDMDDGIGLTHYTYHPITSSESLGAGLLESIDGPLNDDVIRYGYDKLGRVVSESINGIPRIISQDYDSLGRRGTTTNGLGEFQRNYDGVTPRLLTLTYPNGQTGNYFYFGNTEDRRLQTLRNLASGTINLSQFDYTYDVEGQVMTWTKLLGEESSGLWFEYDEVKQLSKARNAFDINSATQLWEYEYDEAANRKRQTLSNPQAPWRVVQTDYQRNELNQVNSISTIMGGISIPPLTLLWDAAGNLTNDGNGKTFEWDAANRLTAINKYNERTEFSYDGLSRRVKIVEKTNGTVTSTKQFVWAGTEMAEERDANNDVTRRYYAEGEERLGGPDAGSYFYTRDHLGSITELTDGSGTVQARYDYDPYGKRIKLDGTLDVDFGFTGHYFHASSRLNLSLYRAYDPALGRWLSRDPLVNPEINQGPNLYQYVANNPTNAIDSLGLLYRNWTEAETRDVFLRPAFIAATAGPLQGLLNIMHNSEGSGPYDFSDHEEYDGDTFCVGGQPLDPWQFGNYVAGYQAAAYDLYVISPVNALQKVYLAGAYYHLTGQSIDHRNGRSRDWNPVAGFPMITRGALDVVRMTYR